jgi:hypothetical protein
VKYGVNFSDFPLQLLPQATIDAYCLYEETEAAAAALETTNAQKKARDKARLHHDKEHESLHVSSLFSR